MGKPGDRRIRVTCACGARLAAPPNAAGRRVRCPKCGQPVAVPSASPAAPSVPSVGTTPGDVAISDPLQVGAPPAITPTASPTPPRDDVYRLTPQAPPPKPPRPRESAAVPTQVCPSCRKTLPAADVICVDCGINLKTGRSLLITQDEGLDETYAYTEGLLRWLSWVIPIGAYPVASEAFGYRKPWVVRTIAVATTIISLWFLAAVIFNPEPAASHANLMLWSGQRSPAQSNPSHDDFVEAEVRWQPHQLVTYAFLHGGLLHLAGNLLFLLVLGSRVNALIGNILTVALYPVLAAASALAHQAATAGEPLHPMLGASGAVMGLAGMYLVLFPIHKVHMAAW